MSRRVHLILRAMHALGFMLLGVALAAVALDALRVAIVATIVPLCLNLIAGEQLRVAQAKLEKR